MLNSLEIIDRQIARQIEYLNTLRDQRTALGLKTPTALVQDVMKEWDRLDGMNVIRSVLETELMSDQLTDGDPQAVRTETVELLNYEFQTESSDGRYLGSESVKGIGSTQFAEFYLSQTLVRSTNNLRIKIYDALRPGDPIGVILLKR